MADFLETARANKLENAFLIGVQTQRMAEGEGDWASLALDLGYFDQAHFIKAFKAVVGRSPADYALAMG